MVSVTAKPDWWAKDQRPDRPSCLIIAGSGGKDSEIMQAVVVEQYRDVCPIIFHHQDLPENWAGTPDYVVAAGKRLNVEVVVEKPHYTRFICDDCGHDGLAATPRLRLGEGQSVCCTKCRQGNTRIVGEVLGLLDLMEWRRRWPSDSIRFCTSYLKEALLDAWCSRNRERLGERPYIVMGERWGESRRRAKLSYLEPRGGKKWLQVWHPILSLSRKEVFCGLRERGIEPHYCYAVQWAAQGLTSQQIEQEMYEHDVEGGPRCSCVMCFYALKYIGPNLKLPQNAALLERLQAFTARWGHDIQEGLTLDMLLAGQTKPAASTTRKSRRPRPEITRTSQSVQLALF